MKNTVKITLAEFELMLKNWKGAKPCSVQYITEPKISALGKQALGNVTKVANVNIFVGVNYENSVNNQLEREAKERDFIAQSLWKGKGKRLSLALAEHTEKGTKYLSYMPIRTMRSFYFNSNLELIDKAIIVPYFPERGNYQPTEKEVYHRELATINVRKFKTDKITYEIIHK